ncbi:MAG TPA: hypothetical protein VFV72_07160 [Candidatus Limnocylindrales bacterium]|nr:hypothetical protein [Candidatus Limnocylindrales bacterium]
MTTRLDLDRTLAEWFRADAGEALPDYLDELVDRVAREPQRRWWSSPERWLPVDVTARASTFALPRYGRLAIVALLILAIAAAAVFAVGSRNQRVPPPFGPAANGSIVSWSQSGDIIAADADGSNSRIIVGGPSFDFAPWFSHDGTRFIFWREPTAGQDLVMVANADGSGVRALTDTLLYADWFEWSPADDAIAVVHTQAGTGKRLLSIVDATGKAPLHTLDLPLGVDNDVYWLPPNGDELLFTARDKPEDPENGLYAVKRDGTAFRQVAPVASSHYNNLAVALDGQRIAFSNVEADSSGNGIGWHIHLRDLATGSDTQVTFDPRADGEVDEHEPIFSPDGTQLLLWTQTGDTGRLAVAPSDGTSHARSLGPPFLWDDEYSYAFSPDGRTAILNIGKGTTWLFDLESGKGTRLSEGIPNFASWQRLAQPLP